MAHFRDRLGPAVELFWIIGPDSLAELGTWHRAGELVDACRIITAGRSGSNRIEWRHHGGLLSPEQIARLEAGILQTPTIDISSTDIRRRAGRHESIRYLVPDRVRAYIDDQGLYRDQPVESPPR